MQLSEEEISEFIFQQSVLNKTLADAVSSITKDMHTITKSMKNQEVLLEKMASMEKESNERNKRIHGRVDEIVGDIRMLQQTHNAGGCSALQKTDLKLDDLKEKLLDPENGIIPAIKDQAKEEKKSRVWLWRTLFTIILTALVGLIFSMFKPS